jgi:hypothetical protein
MWNAELAWHVHESVIPTALALLPGRMNSLSARAMMLATAGQESQFRARKQIVKPGVPPPAMGLWQFERGGGVTEILESLNTRPFILPILRMLAIPPMPAAVHEAIAYHDPLAAVCARLLLYRDPRTMPTKTQSVLGWDIYLRNWRPGKPHPEKWPWNFAEAWRIAEGG